MHFFSCTTKTFFLLQKFSEVKALLIIFLLIFTSNFVYSQNGYKVGSPDYRDHGSKINNLYDAALQQNNSFNLEVDKGHKVTLYTQQGFKGKKIYIYGPYEKKQINVNNLLADVITGEPKSGIRNPYVFGSLKVEKVDPTPVVILDFAHKIINTEYNMYRQTLGAGVFEKDNLWSNFVAYETPVWLNTIIIPQGIKVTLTNSNGQKLELPEEKFNGGNIYVNLDQYPYMHKKVQKIKIEQLGYKVISVKYKLVEGTKKSLNKKEEFALIGGIGGDINAVNEDYSRDVILSSNMSTETVSGKAKSFEKQKVESKTIGLNAGISASTSVAAELEAAPLGMGASTTTTVGLEVSAGVSYETMIETGFSEVVENYRENSKSLDIGCQMACPPRHNCTLIGIFDEIVSGEFEVTTRMIRVDGSGNEISGTEVDVKSTLEATMVLGASCTLHKEPLKLSLEQLPEEAFEKLVYMYENDNGSHYHLTSPPNSDYYKSFKKKYEFPYTDDIGYILKKSYFDELDKDEQSKLAALNIYKRKITEGHYDFITTASEVGKKHAIDKGFTLVTLLGYVYKEKQANTDPLWLQYRKDYLDHSTRNRDNSYNYPNIITITDHDGYIFKRPKG